MQEIIINTQIIQLDQLLKWEGIIETGGQVRPMLDDKLILVNGQLATERRKKIHPGDTVEIKGVGIWKIVAE